MKIAKILIKNTSEESYAIFEGDRYAAIRDPFEIGLGKRLERKFEKSFEKISEKLFDKIHDGKFELTGESFGADEIELLCPCTPSKVVCVGLNYTQHASELNHKLPKDPVIFLKPPTSVIGPGESIVYPPQSTRVDYEAELAVVIAERCKGVSVKHAHEYILGYTCLNDVTARDLQASDGQWTRCKSFDTFCAIGPMIDTKCDCRDLRIRALLNGKTVQDGRTSMMIRGVDELVSFISNVMTLMPGDIVATGTPAGIGPMQRGDTIDIDIENIGVLRNHIV